MNRFSYSRPNSIEDAVRAQAANARAAFIGGGTNLLDLMKENVAYPNELIDINRLQLDFVNPTPTDGLLIGALVRNAHLAYHDEVDRRYPLLRDALLAGASPQLRNMATVGGNLMQRTRCHYFYDIATSCNKRTAGSGCSALKGQNRIHAILGASDHCVAVHPSDMCVALAALEAIVHVVGPQGERAIRFEDFHRLPGDRPQLDNTLAFDELITGVELPGEGFGEHFAYLKLRDRASYAFALVSVAAALTMTDGVISAARVALGGVAHKPWRNRLAEQSLIGSPPSREAFEAAGWLIIDEAKALTHNRFKIVLAQRAIVRALSIAAGLEAR